MSDYCQQCSEEIFGKDFRELAGLVSEEDVRNDKAAIVLCEGCGPIAVDHEGRCLSSDCDKSHGADEYQVDLSP
jgi:hypothetical protein